MRQEHDQLVSDLLALGWTDESQPAPGVSMSWEAFHVQERRWRRDLDAFLVQRIRTPERVQSGRAPRARRTRSTSTSRGDPDQNLIRPY